MGVYKRKSKIRVVYKNGATDQIEPALLNVMIDAMQVDQFKRSDGWAEIGIDATRGVGGRLYNGIERRLG